jgi:hypothetical protein
MESGVTMVYKGKKEQIKGPIIVFIVLLILAAVLLIFARHNWFAVFMAVLFLLPLPMIYSGIIFRIVMDDEKIEIHRPLGKKVIPFKDIAFCAVNALEDNKFLIYAFMKRKKDGIISVKGIKKNISDTRKDFSFDINFNQAEKIPVSFVENDIELKDEILKRINAEHVRLLKM